MKKSSFYSFLLQDPNEAKSNYDSKLALLFLLLVPFHSFAQTSQCDEVPVTIIVDHFGRTELPSILCGDEIYFSVSGLFDFLEVKNEASDHLKVLEGFLQNQEDVFRIEETSSRILYQNQIFQLGSEDFIRTRTGLFLRSDHFESIFGLVNAFSIRELAAKLDPGFELPALKAAKRKQLRENLHRIQGDFTADTTIRRDRPLFHFGAAQWNVNTTQRTDGLDYNRLELGIGGLLAGGEFLGNINYDSQTKFSSQNQFYQWRQVNNQRNFLRQVTVGKISANSVASIYRPVVGIKLTNARSFEEKSFGTFKINEYTEPGWIVELYLDNVLIDYTQADASGFFSFDVPLTYGSTKVSFRYFGPWGEEEYSEKLYHIPFNFISPGEFQYSLTSGIIEDGHNTVYTQARANYGLNNHITIGGGFEYLSSLKAVPISFLKTSVRLSGDMFLSGEYIHQVGFKGDFSYTSPGDLRLLLSYKNYEEEQVAVRFNFLEERKASLSFPLKMGGFTGTSRFNFRQNILRNNTYTHGEWHLAGNVLGLRLNLNNTAMFSEYSDPLIYSRFSTSIRLPENIIFSPQLVYEYGATGISSTELKLRKHFFRRLNVQTSYSHNFKFNQFYLNAGVTLELGFSKVGLNSSVNNRYTALSQSAGGSILYDPIQNNWEFDRRPIIGRGSIQFEPFLDFNGNGKKDQEEPTVQGVEVNTNAGGMRRENPEGSTIFVGLEPYIPYHFEIDTRHLKRIAWQTKLKSLNIFVNPNQIKIVEIPVKVMGEVSGFVLDEQGKGIGGIKIEIKNSKNEFVTTITSESDGYFSFLGLSSGTFSAEPSPAQLAILGIKQQYKSTFEIENDVDGDIVDSLEFHLKI